ncbi:hypothetical protein F0562_016544 [Nyssa sinensis]|uniref:Uncharacterized protein n=1 Tax=Nyssa sinensis TaxID=561372 RepID=A0A5J4ZFZ2_9ASTE|nr:hypothetical protein F0562_016544 [Nyssa sinensis]
MIDDSDDGLVNMGSIYSDGDEYINEVVKLVMTCTHVYIYIYTHTRTYKSLINFTNFGRIKLEMMVPCRIADIATVFMSLGVELLSEVLKERNLKIRDIRPEGECEPLKGDAIDL